MSQRETNPLYPLNSRQAALYDFFEQHVAMYGQFDQTAGPDGAHYMTDNPFVAEGLQCANCAFYEGTRACELVAGDIAPDALCKFWIIPEALVVRSTGETPMNDETRREPKPAIPLCERSVQLDDCELRAEGDGRTLTGYAAVFNTPTRIDSWEGRFDEQFAPGAFTRSIQARMPVLMYNHGKHQMVGEMPIGAITSLREDPRGLRVEAQLFDNHLVEPVRQAIAGGAITGMSIRMQVLRETVDESGDLPMRTIHEARIPELGPVNYPAYPTTTVGVRSEDLAAPAAQAPQPATDASPQSTRLVNPNYRLALKRAIELSKEA
jgi:HK97 family phage prohead protease